MNMHQNSKLALAIAVGVATSVSATDKVVFFENFDGVALGPNVEEGIVTGSGGPQDAVWSPDFPAGWTETFSLDGVGVLEFQGWNLVDASWWAMTAGDQRRTEFSDQAGALAKGAIAITDPDEWDDYDANGLDPSAEGEFDAFMTTPEFDITGATPGSATLSFFSSWRDENPQKAIIEVSYDGGSNWTEVLRWEGDSGSADHHDDFPNEWVQGVALNNGGSDTSCQVRFSTQDAGNNWWWAVDSITVVADTTAPDAYAPAPFFMTMDTFNYVSNPVVTYTTAAGATDYDVVFAKDAEFTDIAGMVNTTDPSMVEIPFIDSGVYFVKVVANNDAGSTDSCNVQQIAVDNPCAADLNGDGVLDIFDVLEYLARFDAGC